MDNYKYNMLIVIIIPMRVMLGRTILITVVITIPKVIIEEIIVIMIKIIKCY